MNEGTYLRAVQHLSHVYELVRTSNFAGVENVLLAMNFQSIETEILEAYLRALYPLRKQLPNYGWFRGQAKLEMERRKIDCYNLFEELKL